MEMYQKAWKKSERVKERKRETHYKGEAIKKKKNFLTSLSLSILVHHYLQT